MNPIFTYMWQRQPYVAWKSAEQMQSSAVPTWSRPLVNGRIVPKVHTYVGKEHIVHSQPNGPSFKARPIKHWRKQLDPRSGSGQGRSGVGMPMDVPGGKVALSAPNDICNCANAKKMKDYIMPDNRYKNSTTDNNKLASFKFLNPDRDNPRVVCVACSPQANITRPATTILSKKYYTDSRAYLRARNKRYEQNLSGTDVGDVKYKDQNGGGLLWPSDSQDGQLWNGPQVRAGANCTPKCCRLEENCQAKMVYKPNNRSFSVQGAVDSSTRLDRLKLNTITKSSNSQKGSFGHEGATASRYRGTATAPYYLKSKYQVCVPHHKNGDHALCFNVPTGSVGDKFPIIPGPV